MATIALRWNDNSTDEDNFILERKVVGESFSTLATIAADVTFYADEAVSLDTDYVYRILARNTGGDSAYSNELPARLASTPVRFGLRAIYV